MTRVSGVLVRISEDRAGEALGVDRQEQDCRALVARKGWQVGKVYVENDTSAYKRRKVTMPDGTTALRVVRPAFLQLLADIRAGAVTALVAYDLDRVARDPRDLEDLIDAVEQTGIPTAAVTGEVDLSTDNGIFMARMLVNVANKSSRDTSRRVRRALLSLAEQGVATGGRRPYGYQADRVTPDEREAEHVRWAFEQALTGASLAAIGRGLTERDPVRAWTAEGVRRLLQSPRRAGLRVHRGEVLGPGSWEPLVERDLWEQVQANLAGRTVPDRVTVGGPGKYLLRGLLMCGKCSTDLALVPLRTRGRTDAQKYGCPSPAYGGCGGITVQYAPVERFVVDLLLAHLSTVSLAPAVPGDLAADVRERIARLERRSAALVEAFAADDDGDPVTLRAATRALQQKADVLRRQVAQQAQTARTTDARSVVREWRAGRYSDAQKRAVVVEFIDHVMVGPHPGGPKFRPSRLRVVPRVSP